MTFSSEFIIENLPLTWTDLLWGYRHQLIGWRVPVEYARVRVEDADAFNELASEMATVDKDADWKVGELLAALSVREPSLADESKAKWLYLSVLDLYNRRDQEDDLDAQIDSIYADFDYPDEISHFAPIMRSQYGYDWFTTTQAENRLRTEKLMKAYLANMNSTYTR